MEKAKTEPQVKIDNMTLGEVILRINAAIPKISKEERNKHGSYNYVPIDDYYERVASVAAANGLTWNIVELECKQISDTKRGEPIFAFRYRFDLLLEDGREIRDYTQFTVVISMQGAQTSGAAASYAEKIFMRTAFKVVTGEKDADATAAIDWDIDKTPKFEAKERSATVVKDKPQVEEISDWESVALVIKTAIALQKTYEDLRQNYKDNLPIIDEMKDKAHDKWQDIQAEFKKASDKLRPALDLGA